MNACLRPCIFFCTRLHLVGNMMWSGICRAVIAPPVELILRCKAWT